MSHVFFRILCISEALWEHGWPQDFTDKSPKPKICPIQELVFGRF